MYCILSIIGFILYYIVAVKWEDEWGSKCSFSHGDSKSAGVSVMFRNGFDFKVNDSILDQNGRYIILDLTVYERYNNKSKLQVNTTKNTDTQSIPLHSFIHLR
jgi:hypothetical protein